MADKLILVASYPKSGNTWVRLVLQGLVDASSAGDVNAVESGFYGAHRRQLFDELAPANAADLTPAEIDDFLPSVNTAMADMLREPAIVKTHELVRKNRKGDWVFPPDRVGAVLHLIRHPFDVAVSFANHMGWSVEQAVREMRSDFRFSQQQRKLELPFPEPVGSWSNNVIGWTKPDQPYRCITMRYEDMLRDDLSCFRKLGAFAGLTFTEEELERAVLAARFEKLQAQEASQGFRERPKMSKQFFRSGKTHSWQGALSEELRADICETHAEVMSRYGYQADGNTSS